MMTSKIAKHPLEWIVFTVSLAVVAGTVGFLAWDAMQAGGYDSPAALSVELGRPEPRDGAWAVPVTVRNQGRETAEGVRVEVILEIPGAAPETADFEAAFVPRQSKREGWVTFRSDPSRGRLSGRAAGYETP
ncbi:MAG TPA: hypothetical protein VNM67_21560 [Thermoanaerobaculia bacterium]|nr:hypothetical protein [Thermoanaerobaculia bacterium]